nr:unnamed protein product [Callosobruchus analis]
MRPSTRPRSLREGMSVQGETSQYKSTTVLIKKSEAVPDMTKGNGWRA